MLAINRGIAEAAAITLDENTGEIIVGSIYSSRREGSNVYRRILAASQDSRTYTLGYGELHGAGLGFTGIAREIGDDGFVPDNASIPIVIDRQRIIQFRSRFGHWRGDAENMIGETVVHELVLHAGRLAMGLRTGHQYQGGHSGSTTTSRYMDNRVDEEAHFISRIFGIPGSSPFLRHRGARAELDLSTYRMQGPPPVPQTPHARHD